MRNFTKAVKQIFNTTDRFTVFILSFFVVMLGYLFLENGKDALSVFSFESFSFLTKIKLFSSTLFDLNSFFQPAMYVLVSLSSLFTAFVASFLYIYFKTRGQVLIKRKVYSGFGLFFAVIGVGCAACGAVFLQVILSVFGFGGILKYFPYDGVEVGYLGLLILIINAFSLAKKVNEPLVC